MIFFPYLIKRSLIFSINEDFYFVLHKDTLYHSHQFDLNAHTTEIFKQKFSFKTQYLIDFAEMYDCDKTKTVAKVVDFGLILY